MGEKVSYDSRLAARTYAAEGTDWHIDAGMSEIAIQFAQDLATTYIASQIFPVVPVAHQNDRFYTWNRQDWFIKPQTLRARATAPKRIQATISSAGYFAHNYMLETPIPYEDLSNADEALNIEESSARLVMQLLMLDYEDRVATLLTTATNVGTSTTLAGTNQWSDRANSDPISDVNTGKSWMVLETGFEPNTLIVSYLTHVALRQHPDIIDRIKYVQRATQASVEQALADIFGVERYLVGRAVKNTAAEGQADTMSYIWGKTATLLYVPPAPGKNIPSAGYSFRWRPEGFSDFVVETKDDDNIKARLKRVGYFQAEVLTAPVLSYLIAATVA